MTTHTVLTLARALGGEIVGNRVIAPGPGHTPRDRSLSVWASPEWPGFSVHSFAGDDWRTCRDHVAHLLQIPRDRGKKPMHVDNEWAERRALDSVDDTKRTSDALAIWNSSADPRGTLAETYLASRGLDLPDELAGEVLRWNSRLGALVALFRNIRSGEPQAITRIFLDREGRKLGRKFLGPVRGAAIMLDPPENVLHGLHVGEGIETCMAGRQMGFMPTWALGSAGAIEAFPVLAGIDAITIFAETDDSGANARAIERMGARRHQAGREVYVVAPLVGGDMNDAILGRRAG